MGLMTVYHDVIIAHINVWPCIMANHIRYYTGDWRFCSERTFWSIKRNMLYFRHAQQTLNNPCSIPLFSTSLFNFPEIIS